MMEALFLDAVFLLRPDQDVVDRLFLTATLLKVDYGHNEERIVR